MCPNSYKKKDISILSIDKNNAKYSSQRHRSVKVTVGERGEEEREQGCRKGRGMQKVTARNKKMREAPPKKSPIMLEGLRGYAHRCRRKSEG